MPPEAARTSESPMAEAPPTPVSPMEDAVAMLDNVTDTLATMPSPMVLAFNPVATQRYVPDDPLQDTLLPAPMRALPAETAMLLTVAVGYESCHWRAAGGVAPPDAKLSVNGTLVAEAAVAEDSESDCAVAVPISVRESITKIRKCIKKTRSRTNLIIAYWKLRISPSIVIFFDQWD